MTLKFRAGLLVAIGLFAASAGIQAAEYTRDPCITSAAESLDGQVLQSGGDQRGQALQQRAQTLREQGSVLDREIHVFNARCDIGMDEGSPEEVACGNERPARMADLAQQNISVRAFNKDVVSFIDQVLPTLENRLAGTRAELRKGQHNADQWAADARQWIGMQNESRNRARAQAIEIVVGEVIDKFREDLDAKRLLSEAELKVVRAWSARVGGAVPAAIAREVQTRAQNLRAARDVVAMLKYVYDQHATAYTLIDAARGEMTVAETMVELVASFPLGAQIAPNVRKAAEVILLVDKDMVAGLTSWIVDGRLNELIELQESQFATMKRFSALYVALVKAKKTLPQVRERCLAP